ncbi:MAG TPA: DNA mismatch repair endonuclease MutH [Aeromonadales bacterium]|nr:DNA mismatch repair endonuclease MutH [Aeromonadales bacterium]
MPNNDRFEQLQSALKQVAGCTLGEVAYSLKIPVPPNLLKNKGWVGQLIETALGVENNSRPEPDFPELGIELKTLPINAQGKPKESTYICVAPLTQLANLSYESSVVGQKLAHVLWLPIEAESTIPLAERRIGQGIFWQPNAEEFAQLKTDFNEITDQIALGEVENITAHQGSYLQLRPKAANSSALTEATSPDGESMMTLPRGFYLRPGFTQRILQHYY